MSISSSNQSSGSADSTGQAPKRLPRVAIVGVGFVGSTTAYALLLSGVPAEVVLINRHKARAEGHVQDLRDAAVFSHNTRIVVGDFADCCSADVIVLTTGASQLGLKSRFEGLRDSAAILKGLVRDVARQHPCGIMVVASNPVDVLTYAAWKWSGLPPTRVIGSGTSLDTSRFRRRIAERYGVSTDNVHAYIIGEHGDSQVPVFSSARIAGLPLRGFCRQTGVPYDPDALNKIAKATRTAGFDIVSAKGATYYGIGTALARIVRAILLNEHALLTVSLRPPDSLGLGEVCLSLPAVVSRDGVSRIISLPLNEKEQIALRKSAETLKSYISMLDMSLGAAA